MAYAASLGDMDSVYLDTDRAQGVYAHPLFAICPEWPVALASRDLLRAQGLSEQEFRRAVHASHDSHVYRLIRPGDELRTQATVLNMEMRRPGAYVTTCFDTRDAHNELVCRTFHGMLFRDVELEAVNKAPTADHATDIDIPPTAHQAQVLSTTSDYEQRIDIAANLAHTYTDCARIYNPIHTDAAVAKAAGLPQIILHGSATLGLAVSAITRRYADAQPPRIKRICTQFRGMVLMPSVLKLRCFTPYADHQQIIVPFDMVNDSGGTVLNQGSVTIRTEAE